MGSDAQSVVERCSALRVHDLIRAQDREALFFALRSHIRQVWKALAVEGQPSILTHLLLQVEYIRM